MYNPFLLKKRVFRANSQRKNLQAVVQTPGNTRNKTSPPLPAKSYSPNVLGAELGLRSYPFKSVLRGERNLLFRDVQSG